VYKSEEVRELTRVKDIVRPDVAGAALAAGLSVSGGANFFEDLKAATGQLKSIAKGQPLSSRLVSEQAVRRLQEKVQS